MNLNALIKNMNPDIVYIKIETEINYKTPTSNSGQDHIGIYVA